MDYKSALEKLERFRQIVRDERDSVTGALSSQQYDELYLLYGELEPIISGVLGADQIEVPLGHGGKALYPNFIEAGYLSGRTIHTHVGYTQLMKVIGRVRQLATDPTVPLPEPSISALARSIRRFRECCQFLQSPPQNERDVQDVLWIILRSHFDRVDREDTLPRFGAKSYRPDFGIPDLRVLLEVKFIGEKTDLPRIQEEILADVPGYLGGSSTYTGIFVFVYDAAQKLRDPRKFIEDLRSVDGILDVLVVPGIG